LAKVAVQCSADTFVVKIATFTKPETFPTTTMLKLHPLLFAIAIVSCSNHTTNEARSNKPEGVNAAASKQEVHAFSGDPLVLPKSELTRIYTQSIADYIKAVNQDYAITFDTLFFGKHRYGQPDDFPDIQLPETIANTQIRLVTPEFGAQKQKDNRSSFYINLMGWVNDEKMAFLFVTFSNNNTHQFDYYLDYTYNTKSKTFELDTIRFENFLYKRN
jgi:hypothetical protein